MIVRALALAAFALAPLAAGAQEASPQLSLEQRTLVRCSAAFALVANRQQAGEADALAFPAVGGRGREYFVRAMASLMDSAGLDREAVSALLAREAQGLAEGKALYAAMPGCLLALEASGL